MSLRNNDHFYAGCVCLVTVCFRRVLGSFGPICGCAGRFTCELYIQWMDYEKRGIFFTRFACNNTTQHVLFACPSGCFVTRIKCVAVLTFITFWSDVRSPDAVERYVIFPLRWFGGGVVKGSNSWEHNIRLAGRSTCSRASHWRRHRNDVQLVNLQLNNWAVLNVLYVYLCLDNDWWEQGSLVYVVNYALRNHTPLNDSASDLTSCCPGGRTHGWLDGWMGVCVCVCVCKDRLETAGDGAVCTKVTPGCLL